MGLLNFQNTQLRTAVCFLAIIQVLHAGTPRSYCLPHDEFDFEYPQPGNEVNFPGCTEFHPQATNLGEYVGRDGMRSWTADTHDPNLCEYRGCLDQKAANYKFLHSYGSVVGRKDKRVVVPDNEMCEYDTAGRTGCTDIRAYNFDARAVVPDNETCKYAGCLDPRDLRYKFLDDRFDKRVVVHDEEMCKYPTGCMDPTATNFDGRAVVHDNGMCRYHIACSDPNAVNCGDVGVCRYLDDYAFPAETLEEEDWNPCSDPSAVNFGNMGECQYLANNSDPDDHSIFWGPPDEFAAEDPAETLEEEGWFHWFHW